MTPAEKSSVAAIRQRFDADVERFSNLDTGQAATIDAALCMDLVARAAASASPQGRAVLDIGCGAGNYALKLREYLPLARFTLVDLSEPMLRRAQARLGTSVAAVEQRDIRECQFPDASFDIILAAAVLHHLRSPAEWERMFERLYTWLRPGGSVWIFDLVAHEAGPVHGMLWSRYGDYLAAAGGPDYREKVFRYIDQEDSPAPLTYQLDLLRRQGFATVDVLHKHACFAAFGACKAAVDTPGADGH